MAAPVEGEQKIFGFVLPSGVDGELVKQSVLTYLALGILLSVFLFFVLPRFADLVAVANKVAALQKREDELNGTRAALDTFRTNVDAAAKEAVFLAVPVKYDPGLILLSLRKLADDNKVSLNSYSLSGGKINEEGEEVAPGRLNTNDVAVEIAGPPLALIGYIDKLDKYLPLVSVKDLSISEVSKILLVGGGDLKLEMELTYYNMPVSVSAEETLSGKLLTESDLEKIQSLSTYNRLEGISGTRVAPVTGAGKDKLFGF